MDDTETALLDSAASLTLVKIATLVKLNNTTHQPKLITIPDGTKMKTTAELAMAMPKLPPGARKAHVMPGLAHNLLALPQLCDNGCIVTFTKDNVEATLNSEIVLGGWRDISTNLWRVPIKQEEHTMANILYDCANQEQLTHFYHACCFSPVPETWIHAINKGYFRGWPHLTAKNVRPFIINKPATLMGHLQKSKQGMRSTKVKTHITDQINNKMPEQEEHNNKMHHIYIALEDIKGKIFSDQTGKFPRTSSRGMKYVMIFMSMTLMPLLHIFYATERQKKCWTHIKTYTRNLPSVGLNLNSTSWIMKYQKRLRTLC